MICICSVWKCLIYNPRPITADAIQNRLKTGTVNNTVINNSVWWFVRQVLLSLNPLKMEAVRVSETSVPTYQTTRCNNPYDHNINILATVYPVEYSGIWDSGYGLVGRGSCMGKKCYSPQCIHIGCGAHPALCSVDTWALPPNVKWLRPT